MSVGESGTGIFGPERRSATGVTVQGHLDEIYAMQWNLNLPNVTYSRYNDIFIHLLCSPPQKISYTAEI